MAVDIDPSDLQQLLAEAKSAHPRECCGILLGECTRITAITPAANVHPNPETQFEIDPQALVDAHRDARSGGPQVAGYYHSHPNGLAEPSSTDREQATRDGSIWAIIAGDTITFWHDGEEGFVALPYRIVDR
ncbi:Mov34/MPN/PAD-1 family protein [Altererythrobacter sp. MF3-039]|uniref:Mov34/MPN/PAD-1 family protein n=1 Tax=Altererythrobacter sp. MF3-039 TaxID=3252901 RepID=UPI00390CAA95